MPHSAKQQRTRAKIVSLSSLAAAALHGEEAGEAEDEEVQRADHYGGGEAQIGTGALSLFITIHHPKRGQNCSQ